MTWEGSEEDLVQLVLDNLSDDLRRAPWRGTTNLLAGHCYVVAETLHHLLGGSECGWKPMFIRHEGAPHWFIQHREGRVLDPTAGQFQTPVVYEKAIGKGFLTPRPSQRAQELIKRCLRSNSTLTSRTSPRI